MMTILSLLPIISLLVCLVFLKVSVARAGGISLAIAFVIALAFFGLPVFGLTIAVGRALTLVLFVSLIVWCALFLYHLVDDFKAIDVINKNIVIFVEDRFVQFLLLAWLFSAFLQGIAGFGVPVLIPGSILAALGFNPMLAVIVCLVANSAPTPFAAIGIPVSALSGVTGLDPGVLGFNVALQLFIPCLILPFFLVMLVGGGIRAVRGVGLITLISGLSFAVPLLLVSRFIGPELPTLLGSVCAIVCVTLASKRFYRDDAHNKRFQIDTVLTGGTVPVSIFQACLPFGLVLVIVTATSLIKPVHDALAGIGFDTVVFAGEGGHTLSFALLLTPGVLILISLIIACLLQKRRFSELLRIAGATVFESRKTAVTIVTIIAMAKVMDYSGMTDAIALMLITVFAAFYPLVAPVIGMIGTFITGSDTTCAILFGSLQAGAARAIGADPAWIASSNLSAAAAGKMISPQSVAIGLRIGGLEGREGEIIRQTLRYALICTGIICFITFGGTLF